MEREIVKGCTCMCTQPDLARDLDVNIFTVISFVPVGTEITDSVGAKLITGLPSWKIDTKCWCKARLRYVDQLPEKYLMRIDGNSEDEETETHKDIDKEIHHV